MPLLPAAPLDLPPPPPPVRSLLGSARPLQWPDGRLGAIEVRSECVEDGRVVLFDACDFDEPDAPPANSDVRTWEPFVARASSSCSAVTWRNNGPEYAQGYLRADRSRQVAHEFWTGHIAANADWAGDPDRATNLWLADADSVTVIHNSATGFRRALADLEQALAPCAGQSMIHTTLAVATLWASLGLVTVSGSDLRTTVGGTVVVADAGYPGTAPGQDGGSAPAASHWAYGTGVVYRLDGDVELSPAEGDLANAMWSRQNVIEWSASQLGIVFWDGCCHVGLPVDLTTP